MIARYRALFSTPGVSRLLVSSVVGRLPSGMFSLAILLFVHGSTGSFLAAGLAVGAFSLAGAAIGPLLGAQVDRHGQTRVLLGAALAQAGLLVALVLVTQADAPVAAIVALAALAGGALPPIGGCVRALWPEVAHGGELRDRLRPGRDHSGDDLDARPTVGGPDGGVCLARRGGGAVRRADDRWGRLLRELPLSRGWRADRRGARAGERTGRQPQPAHAALHGCARGGGDRGGRGGAARAGGGAGRALVFGSAARPVQPRQHDRRPDLLRQELGP